MLAANAVGDVAEHLAAELQRDERRAEARRRAPVWNSGIACITLATRSMPSATPDDHLRGATATSAAPASCGFISCCSCVLRCCICMLDVLALQRQLGQLLLDLPDLLLADVADARRAARSRSRRAARPAPRRPCARARCSVIAPKLRISSASRTRAIEQEAEAVVRRRRVEAGDHAAQVDAGGGRAHEQPGIDRRIEQRQLPHDALDVHAVADLEQPVGDRVPVLVELRVGRRAEVLRRHAQHGGGAAAIRLRVDAERPAHLEVLDAHFEVREQVEPAAHLLEGERRLRRRSAGSSRAAARGCWRPGCRSASPPGSISIVSRRNSLSPHSTRLSMYFITTAF